MNLQKDKFQLSLGQWSLHRTFFGEGITDWDDFFQTLASEPDSLLNGIDPIEFPKMAVEYGFDTVELVNTFYFSKVNDFSYWEKFKRNCSTKNVSVTVILCDGLGDLGDSSLNSREKALNNHIDWIEVAVYLGAQSIRVNAKGDGSKSEIAKNMINSLRILAEYGRERNINILVENHGGYSSNAYWLASIIKKVNRHNVGILPDFGNFSMGKDENGQDKLFDPYKGMALLLPYAKAVSAKSFDFNESGEETTIDYDRMLELIKLSGFKGFIGIEYEGDNTSEKEGILKTKKLLQRFI